jgi:hypothetical protein
MRITIGSDPAINARIFFSPCFSPVASPIVRPSLPFLIPIPDISKNAVCRAERRRDSLFTRRFANLQKARKIGNLSFEKSRVIRTARHDTATTPRAPHEKERTNKILFFFGISIAIFRSFSNGNVIEEENAFSDFLNDT